MSKTNLLEFLSNHPTLPQNDTPVWLPDDKDAFSVSPFIFFLIAGGFVVLTTILFGRLLYQIKLKSSHL